MAAKRQTKKVNIGITMAQAEDAFAEYAKADARTAQITAKMDVEITKIRERYQAELAELAEIKVENFEIVEAFALENRTELFSKKKSLETVHGVFGFRSGNPQLKNIKGFTWAAVTKLLEEFLPTHVRTKSEPDKERLLADREVPEVAEKFEKCGISVVQDESFFVEPKKEEV